MKKTWTMPRVTVEGFAANEYVAACSFVPTDLLTKDAYYVWDIWEDNGSYSGVLYKDGQTPSNKYDTPNLEGFTYGRAPAAASTTAYGFEQNTWYTNKTFYTVKGNASGMKFNNSDYFSPVGTFDVYIKAGVAAWVYPQGTAGGGTPSEEKNVS